MVCTRIVRAFLSSLVLVAAAGCQDETIRTYQAARIEAPPSRLLGAILPVRERVWFATVTGPASAVGELLPQFEAFVMSLRFPENERRLVSWTLPADWHREANVIRKEDKRLGLTRASLRYATFRAGPYGLEVKVHSFGPESAAVLPNVNRWRGQIGLTNISEAELPQVSRPINVNGVAGTFVDMTGVGANTRPTAPPQEPPPAPKGAGAKPLTFDQPPGWVELPAGGFRYAAFRINEADRKAEVTVVPLGGAAGGLLANVNRWRQQLKLPETTEEQVRREAKEIEVAGERATYVDLLGPESGGPARERTLAVIVPRGEQTWFFKMTGPADLVGKQQPSFEAFVRSVRFGAGGKS